MKQTGNAIKNCLINYLGDQMLDRVKGKLKWFSSVKGYGFITLDGSDYFVHHSELKNDEEFLEGDDVEFSIKQTEKGFSAINITSPK